MDPQNQFNVPGQMNQQAQPTSNYQVNQPAQMYQMPQQPAGHSSSKKWLIIILGIVFVLLLGYFLRGMFGFTQKVSVNGINGEVTKNMDGSMTVKSDYGTVNYGNNKLPDNWPTDIPMYTNGTITTSVALDPKYTGTSGSTLAFSTSDSVQAVSEFYNKELSGSGWTVTMGTTMGPTTVMSARKDNRLLTIGIMNGSTINVNLTVSVLPNSPASTAPSKDSQMKSTLSNMRAQGELYYNASGSYKGFCTSKGSNGAYSLAKGLPSGTNYKCSDASAGWAAGVELSANTFWCADSSGYTGNVASLPKSPSCK